MRDNVSQIRTYDTRVANSFTLSGYIIYAYIYIYIFPWSPWGLFSGNSNLSVPHSNKEETPFISRKI